MAKKVVAQIKLQIVAGKANPSPPVGPALGQHGVNIMEFCKAFNAKTASQEGMVIPVVITVFADRSFTFITKTPPASVLLLKAAGLEKGSKTPKKEKCGKISPGQGRGDREAEAGRPRREGPRRRRKDGRGDGAQHGARRRLTGNGSQR